MRGIRQSHILEADAWIYDSSLQRYEIRSQFMPSNLTRVWLGGYLNVSFVSVRLRIEA
jgi:hypothetical protein